MREIELDKLFNDIYINHYKKVCYCAMKYLRNDSEAKCVAQDVFLSLWENIQNIEQDKEILPYLFVLTKYKCLNVLRKKGSDTRYKDKKRKHDEDSIMHSALSETSSLLFSKEIEMIFKKALKKMPPNTKETFDYSRNERMKYQEIAQKQNVSVKTVEYRMSSALRLLRVELSDYLSVVLLFLLLK